MAEERKRSKKLVDPEENIFNDNIVSSATECTGLTPSSILNEDEVDSYMEIYNIPLADDSGAAPGRAEYAPYPEEEDAEEE